MSGDLGPTNGDLIEAARRAGFDLTPEQLKGWRRAGLLPRPRQQHVKGRRGSETRYPPFAVDQIVAVRRVRDQHKKLDVVLLELWWQGHWVDPTALRRLLEVTVRAEVKPLADLAASPGDPRDAVDRVAVAARDDTHHPIGRLLSTRLGRDRGEIPTVVHAALLPALGVDPSRDDVVLDEPDNRPRKEVLERALGFDKVRQDKLIGDVGPLAPEADSAEAVLHRLSETGQLSPEELIGAVQWSTPEELECARLEAVAFVDDLGTVIAALEDLHGRTDIAGLGVLRAYREAPGYWRPRVLLVAQLVLQNRHRTQGELENRDQIIRATRDAADQVRAALENVNSPVKRGERATAEGTD